MNIRRAVPKSAKIAAKDLIAQQVKQSLPHVPTENEIKAIVAAEIKKALAPKPKPVPDYGENTIINHPVLENSRIVFKGTGNILYCDEGVELKNSLLHFSGSNSLIYLSNGEDTRYSSVHMATQHNSTIYIGPGTNFNSFIDFRAHLSVGEQKNMIIGNNCMFSFSMWATTSDAHAAFDMVTRQRFNLPKSVLIGDHVWVGQEVTILKGTQIGSGSIIGADSLITGKVVQSNAVYAGVPAKLVRSDVFYSRPDIQAADKVSLKTSQANAAMASFSSDASGSLSLEQIDKALSAANTSQAKLDYVRQHIVANKNKNRFYINPEGRPSSTKPASKK